jgi:murein DD-endopeptidase MepM/ murein hydrolase activator NlpD
VNLDAVTKRPRTHAGRATGAVLAAWALTLLGGAPAATAQSDPAAQDATSASAESSATAPATGSGAPAAGTRVVAARARPRSAFYFGTTKISFAIKLAAKAPTDLRIDIVRAGSGALERTLWQQNVPPNRTVTVPWDGLSGSGAFVMGRFRLVIRGANGQAIRLAKRLMAAKAVKRKGKKKKGKKSKLTFTQFDHIFPVRGKHTYGDGIGAPRGDHTHQGQDISAACGTNLAAAQGGTVQVNAYQAGGAGYYVVIDTVGSDIDHVYMHLIAPPALYLGQVVPTGQIIGQVGNTGSSSGCHLHFEMWSGPGWYEGGAFLDPSSYLRLWDKFS